VSIPPEQRPIVFVGPYEHHSNELPWRESIAEVVVVPEDRDGHIDQAYLAEQLVRYAGRPVGRQTVPAPQLRRRSPQRPIRHPSPRRLLLRRALRASPARHRHRHRHRHRASHAFEQEISLGCEGIKPGWTRINFNYFLTDTGRCLD
jgi:hypothetical protein